MKNELILILDFGGQYKELIARAVRGLGVYSEIRGGDISAEEIARLAPIGIILTGGPKSAYLSDSPKLAHEVFSLGVPILGICYGMHMMCHVLGGTVKRSKYGEYGVVSAELKKSVLFENIPDGDVLMSHRDNVSGLPDGFVKTASTRICNNAACEDTENKLYGVQFHPETAQTTNGREILSNFLYKICGASGNYRLDDYITSQIAQIREKLGYGQGTPAIGEEKILLALSGGVDSSVCAALLAKAVPNRLVCVFVDHGFMRENEGDEIEEIFSQKDLQFVRVNAAERFLAKVKGVTDPEEKRKIIGVEFIRVFEEQAREIGAPYLAQGTIYPDIVESGGTHAATIKSHHNVGGLPENLNFREVIEPLSGLFKDEVRVIGKKLGLPAALVNRPPFPGPGLAIRVIGKITAEKLKILRRADAILREEMVRVKNKPSQYFCVLTDTRTVGVKGDDRTFDRVVAIRAVTTDDFMTCEYTPLSHGFLSRVSMRITSEIAGVSRVVYDITSKPPATVEWE